MTNPQCTFTRILTVKYTEGQTKKYEVRCSKSINHEGQHLCVLPYEQIDKLEALK